MIWENWLVAISVGIIAIAFVVLVVYVILALLAIRQMLNDLDKKVHALDPLFRIVSRAGNIMERQADKKLSDAEASFFEEPGYKKSSGTNAVMEIAEWALVGLALWQKIKERRR